MKRILFIISLAMLFSCSKSKVFTAPSEVKAGTTVNIEYSNPISSTAGNQCWIAIVKKGSAESEWGVWKYVEDKATSDVLIAPDEAGYYEIRLHDNYPKESNHLVASLDLTIN